MRDYYTLTVQTDDGIVGSVFGLTEMDRGKDRGKVLTPDIDHEIDRSKVLTPRRDCKIYKNRIVETDLWFLEKSRKIVQNNEKMKMKKSQNLL